MRAPTSITPWRTVAVVLGLLLATAANASANVPSAPPQPLPSAASGPQQSGWHPLRPPLSTPWTRHVSPRNDWSAYPDPQLTRARWENLNGVWQFAAAGAAERPPIGRALRQRILVPFPMESALSGIGAHHDYSFYRRMFTVPSSWRGQHVLLNFGAVDWQARVWVNGRLVGTHRGGYDPFSLDITGALRRRGVQEVVVGVYAPVDRGGEPVGKQRLHPHGIFYTPSSGIWQTVWLQPVAAAHIDRVDTVPQLASDTVQVSAATTGAAGDTLQAVAYQGQTAISSATGPAGSPLSVPVPNPRLWSPSDPYLYGLSVRLLQDGRVVDAVGSYFGMRSIEVAEVGGVAKVELNGSPVFMLGVLDQGYWPDGLYTAPTPQALSFDLLAVRRLGFDAVRMHMKVQPQLWYYEADRLGLLVWQDMPALASRRPSPAAQLEFTRELRAMVQTHLDHPSIVQWVPFNEGWGEFDPAGVTGRLRSWDPTRLIDTTSGVNCCRRLGADPGDVLDRHAYPGPGAQAPSAAQAAVDGEFGGLELVVRGHTWPGRPFGYERETSSRMLTQRYRDLLGQIGIEALRFGLSGAIYTASTDVEHEADGLITYDRRVTKAQVGAIRAMNEAVIAEGSGPPEPFGATPNLAAAYDNVGITARSAPLGGDFDGNGRSYRADTLAAAGLSPGATVTVDGVPVSWPDVPPGSPDNVVAGGQTIQVGQAGSRLVLLGAASWAPRGRSVSGTGTITYADGTNQSFPLSFGDWMGSSSSGTVVARVRAHGSSRTVRVYADMVGLSPGKTVRSVTLPTVDDGIVAAHVPALHVFALGVG